MIAIQNIVFDFDGTLGDSSEDIIESLYLAFDAVGISLPESVSFLPTHIGPPIWDIILTLMPELDAKSVDEIAIQFRHIYDNGTFDKTRLYNGVKELLYKLREKNIRLFIATTKPTRPTRNILKKFDIDCFVEIATPDVIEGRSLSKADMISYLVTKWELNTARTIMIGDSPSDVIAAYKNGILSIAVSYGYSNRDQLEKSKPYCIIDDIMHLQYVIGV